MLALFSLTVIGELISTDYYLRNEPTRKATRELVALGIPISAESAVVAARQGDIAILPLALVYSKKSSFTFEPLDWPTPSTNFHGPCHSS